MKNRLGVMSAGIVITIISLGAAPAFAEAPVELSTDPPITLVEDTFGGKLVADSKWLAVGDACLTGASEAPPIGASNIGPCVTSVNAPEAGITPGYLQLTDTQMNQRGAVLYNSPIPSTEGIKVTFDLRQYGTIDDIMADGTSFFLTDGDSELEEPGAWGAALGYAQHTDLVAGVTQDGVKEGYLGVGIDLYGNFSNPLLPSVGIGCSHEHEWPGRYTIGLRGPGTGQDGYCFLTAAQSQRIALDANKESSLRNYQISVSGEEFPLVTVAVDFSGTRTDFQEVLEYRMTDPAPPSYKFGFSGSTGRYGSTQLLSLLTVETINTLGQPQLVKRVAQASEQPSAYSVGDEIPYEFVATNIGESPMSSVSVIDPLIPDLSCPAATLSASGVVGSEMICTGRYVVTARDAEQPTLTNTAVLSGTNSMGEVLTARDSVTVKLLRLPAMNPPVPPSTEPAPSPSPEVLASTGAEETWQIVLAGISVVLMTASLLLFGVGARRSN